MTTPSGALTTYLGADVAANRPATPNIATGTVGLWWNTDTKTLDAFDLVNGWSAAGGGGGGSPTPTLIQSAAVAQNGGALSFTLGAAPTAGNMLVCAFTNWSGTPALNSGWVYIASQAPQSDDAGGLCYKIAGTGESATQSPTGHSDAWCGALFEVSNAFGANIAGAFAGASLGGASADSASIGVPANSSLVIGLFMTELAGGLPTATLGGSAVDAGFANQGSGSGSPRATQAWSISGASKGSVTPSVTWSTSGQIGHVFLTLSP